MPLVSEENGIVQLLKQPGSTIVAGDIMAIMTLDDPSKVKHALPFEVSTLENILKGYDNQVIMNASLQQLIEVLRNPKLPYSEWKLHISALHSRLPAKLDEQMEELVARSLRRGAVFPARQLSKLIDMAVKNPEYNPDKLLGAVKPMNILYLSISWKNITKLKKLFNGPNVREENIILKLRDENPKDLDKVALTVLSHSKVSAKNNLILAILKHYQPLCKLSSKVSAIFSTPPQHIVELESKATAKVALQAREILIQGALPWSRKELNKLNIS
ncbi:AIF_collapsed_G0031740.mRNA.1.CDS.1 [Saccharomyces cerevisiae]|nr:AIF_collapsed_G0031740.mRNA.1.CDS.1 [Saccharomyces cerevisiae]